MPVYRLMGEPVFPPAREAEPSGLLAVGGDLSPERLLRAYAEGIFPWYSAGEPILWFSPDPRIILRPQALRLDRGMRRTLAKTDYEVTLDRAFDRVIRACAEMPRPGQLGTWITTEMIEAYTRLHQLGYAHSAEAWLEGELAGGVYGVSLGAYFAGESMFRYRSGASLAALVGLLAQLRAWGARLFDCQMESRHVKRMGATALARDRFLVELADALRMPTRTGVWRFDERLAL